MLRRSPAVFRPLEARRMDLHLLPYADWFLNLPIIVHYAGRDLLSHGQSRRHVDSKWELTRQIAIAVILVYTSSPAILCAFMFHA